MTGLAFEVLDWWSGASGRGSRGLLVDRGQYVLDVGSRAPEDVRAVPQHAEQLPDVAARCRIIAVRLERVFKLGDVVCLLARAQLRLGSVGLWW